MALKGGSTALAVDYKSLAIMECIIEKKDGDNSNKVSKGVLREIGSLH